jgi:hypothetical protein
LIIILFVNDLHGLRPRLLATPLRHALAGSPVVVLTGARQTGKSTLTRMLPDASSRTYQTLDDLDLLGLAERDPDALIAASDRLAIDEVQRAPSLLLAVKRAVDRDRRKGQFLLTGSANLLLMRRIAETLAGRATYLTLGPMSAAEIRGAAEPGPWAGLLACGSAAEAGRLLGARTVRPLAWREAISRGGLPPAALEDDREARRRWFDGYVRTYLERDLQQLASIDALPDFRRLLRVAALRSGTLLNQSELAREVGLSQPTVHRYLNLLETSCLIHRLEPYAVNRRKRIVRTPKLYFADPGLAAFLAGWQSGPASEDGLTGALLENLVLVQLLAWRETVIPRPEVLFSRTAAGEEVDLVIETPDRLLPIEVKAGGRPGAEDLRWLGAFLEEHERVAPFGLVLCNAPEVRPAASNILAVPFAAVM